MCGRYANWIRNMGVWADTFADWPEDVSLGYNIAPTQIVPAFILDQNNENPRGLRMRWGLVPSWSKQSNPNFATFNARSETITEKPSFRTAWKKSQTCLIPALGYYEWQGEKGNKQPYFIHAKSQEPLVMAGLWDYWEHDNLKLYSCTIITQPAVGLFTQIHSRMPVMLEHHHTQPWLEDGINRFNLIAKQQHTERFEFYPVSKAVNQSGSEGEQLTFKLPVM